ncbi:MAG: sulfotransferase family 2 domain-containing protein [Verrucomicrobiota bacterium]
MTAFPSVRRFQDKIKSKNTPDAIFIWIPKTAGTSLAAQFCSSGCRKFKSIKQIERGFYPGGFTTFTHFSIAELVEREYLPVSYYNKAIRFSFVRHPVSRVISLYRYLIKKGIVRKEVAFSEFIGVVEIALREELPSRNLINSHIAWEGDCPKYRRGISPSPGLFNSIALSQCRPQVDWLKVPAGLPVEKEGWGCAQFIGKVENLSEDFQALSEKLAYNWPSLPMLNVSSSPKPSLTFDDQKKIEKIYAKDFEAFGYS